MFSQACHDENLRISNRREIRDPLLVIRYKSVGNLGVALQTLLAGVAGKISSANVGKHT